MDTPSVELGVKKPTLFIRSEPPPKAAAKILRFNLLVNRVFRVDELKPPPLISRGFLLIRGGFFNT